MEKVLLNRMQAAAVLILAITSASAATMNIGLQQQIGELKQYPILKIQTTTTSTTMTLPALKINKSSDLGTILGRKLVTLGAYYCRDPDGNNTNTKTTVTYLNQNTTTPKNITDHCQYNLVNLEEATCKGNNAVYAPINCPAGQICLDGACQTNYCSDPDGNNTTTYTAVTYFDPDSRTNRNLMDVC
ncbi:MAG: hypothetical protein V1875_04735, partial [Candidatus Altiarchaeota archaeon]